MLMSLIPGMYHLHVCLWLHLGNFRSTELTLLQILPRRGRRQNLQWVFAKTMVTVLNSCKISLNSCKKWFCCMVGYYRWCWCKSQCGESLRQRSPKWVSCVQRNLHQPSESLKFLGSWQMNLRIIVCCMLWKDHNNSSAYMMNSLHPKVPLLA